MPCGVDCYLRTGSATPGAAGAGDGRVVRVSGCELGRDEFPVALAGYSRQPVMVIDPAIESHYGTGYERSRLFPGGNPSLEYVRSMELLDRLLPRPPARVLDVGGGPGAYAAPLARQGYRVHLVDPVPLHVEQARQAAGADPAGRLHRRPGRRARAVGAS